MATESKLHICIWIFMFLLFPTTVLAQQAGSIRGVVYDKDFDVPLAAAQILIAETGEKTVSTDEGNFIFGQVISGNYTLVFSKDGYIRYVQANVVVSPGKMTDVDTSLSGEFVEMEEFLVQDLQIGGTEAGLLTLRLESPALLDSIGSEWLSQAGVSDAASALKLIAGATVQDGKFAVVRGLPDRYVNSQMNSVRLPSADPDKRAVQLDQFPTEIIESIQVSKTFTPDQQGDASGGAVNIMLKGIPDKNVLKFKSQYEYNTNVTGRNDFLSYDDSGLDFFGVDDDRKDIPNNGNFSDDIGVATQDSPTNYKMSFTAGGKEDITSDIKIGGIASIYYKRDSEYFDDGIDDSLWLDENDPNPGLTPQYGNPDGPPGQPVPAIGEDFKTKLFDVTEGTEEVQWGMLTGVGIETKNHAVNVLRFFTQVAEDKAILAEDTRGKEYYFPGYNPNNPFDLGNESGNLNAAPDIRSETLKYTERTTETIQINGDHSFPIPEIGFADYFKILAPEIDWTVAKNSSEQDEPDERQFGSVWHAKSYNPGNPVFGIPPSLDPAFYGPFKPSANILLGNLSHTWEEITEDSNQYFINLKFPFTQWSNDKGYVKLGLFLDEVDRSFEQDSFGNFRLAEDGPIPTYEGPWGDSYSDIFPSLGGPLVKAGPPFVDVDYEGEQEISAWYYMLDLPLSSFLKFVGGVRYESTELSIINTPEKDAKWVTTDEDGNSLFVDLLPGDADVFYDQDDILPSLGFVLTPIDQVTIRGSYSETIARPTFKELTPIQQQEFLGSDIFIGNPELVMSALKNYDVRVDYRPYKGGLFSFSYFEKDIEEPIEYVQDRVTAFSFTTPKNFPEGKLKGVEVETRQQLGKFWDLLDGLSIGGNATFIDSEVTLPESEVNNLANVGQKETSRDMINTPEHLYNIHLTYNNKRFGSNLGIFYTVKGDTLVAGGGNRNGNFVPDVYAKEFETLNLSLSKDLGKNFKLTFKAKNLFNPEIEEVYRDSSIEDTIRTSYTKGRDFTISLTGSW